LEDNSLYIIVWIGILVLLFLLFKVLPKKMKQTEDRQTKNSLFAIMLILGIPLILIAIIAPILLVAGNENMPVIFKYGYGIISLAVVAYLIYLQITKPKKI
jgi:amino acid permease